MARKTARDFETDRRPRLRLALRKPENHSAWNTARELTDPIEQLKQVARLSYEWGSPCLVRRFWELEGLQLSDNTVENFEAVLLKDTKSTDWLYGDLTDRLTRKACQALRRQGYRVSRLHGDKVDFKVKVFDLARRKMTFGQIARATGKKLSTVKMAYWAAVRMILGSLETQLKRHFQNCPRCQSGKPCKKANTLIDRVAGVSKGSRLIPVGGAAEVYRKPKDDAL